ncbi:MAG: hypothetical protein JST58_16360 [Bacteroidetes bacterium]|nr:hypothetical protein [Bacteroidota bacterium]
MKDEIVQAFLAEVVDAASFEEHRKYFQNMAAYKYDGYQQYSAGKRFIESFAHWLNKFNEGDRNIALDFIRNRLIYVSNEEINALVASCYQDKIKGIIIERISKELNIPSYYVSKITSTSEFDILLRQSLFCGLSDGARTDIFRRSNSGIISHEQIYQTYELSDTRATKMQEGLEEDLVKKYGKNSPNDRKKFKQLFLLDDFSASGSSYLTISQEGYLKGKIAALYDSIFNDKSEMSSVFDTDDLQVHIILYLCTKQAEENINSVIPEITNKHKNTPKLHILHLINNNTVVVPQKDQKIIDICKKEEYYDKKIEDKHTGEVRLGYKSCSLPLVLEHNTPNNSISILWAYENLKFSGLFPRIPRHRES